MIRINRSVSVVITGIALSLCVYIAAQRPVSGQTAYLDARHEYLIADRQLNIVYRKFINRFGDRPATNKKIVAAERAWIVYRDAEANMNACIAAEGGSLYPLFFEESRTELTKERTRMLEQQLKNTEEYSN